MVSLRGLAWSALRPSLSSFSSTSFVGHDGFSPGVFQAHGRSIENLAFVIPSLWTQAKSASGVFGVGSRARRVYHMFSGAFIELSCMTMVFHERKEKKKKKKNPVLSNARSKVSNWHWLSCPIEYFLEKKSAIRIVTFDITGGMQASI